MTRILWDEGERDYFAGVDRGVLYLPDGTAVPWNGLISVDENAESDDVEAIYVDGLPRIQLQSDADFSAHVESFTYPEELDDEAIFGFSYRVNRQIGYQIHLVYNALFVPGSTTKTTLSDDPDISTMAFDLSASPVQILGLRPTAHLVIDSNSAYPAAIADVEKALYGDETTQPSLPSPSALINIFDQHAVLVVIDHGDGSWTATGPDSAIVMLDSTTFQITWPSATYIDDDTYTLRSW